MLGGLLCRVVGGPGVGSGHLMRSLALAQHLSDCGAELTLVTAETGGLAIESWRAEGATIEPAAAPAGSEADLDATRTAARRIGARWVLLDGYPFLAGFQRALREAGLHVAYFDDLASEPAVADLVINPNAGAERLPYRTEGDRTALLLGPRYVCLRRELRRLERRPEGARPHVLVTFGGDRITDVTGEALDRLVAVEGEFDATFISTAGAEEREATAGRAARRPGFRVIVPQPLAPLLADTSLVLCAGGFTTLELAFLGIPSVVMIMVDNQEHGAHALAEAGAVLLGGRGPAALPRAIELVERLIGDAGERRRLGEAGRRLVDGRGVERIADRIAALAAAS